MKLTLDSTSLQQWPSSLADFSTRRLNAAIATALTRTAVEVKEAVHAELPRVFDRPTPYTLNSLYVRPATASRLWAEAGVKDDLAGSGTPATKYLGPEVYGTARNTKRFEAAMRAAGYLPNGWVTAPGPAAKIDAYGNVSRGQIIQVLSQLRITLTAGYTRNMAHPDRNALTGKIKDGPNSAKVRAAVKRAGGRYFVRLPGSGGQPGVYLRDIGSRHALLVFVFVRPPVYARRLDFDGIGKRVSDQRLIPNLDRAISESAARLAAKGTA